MTVKFEVRLHLRDADRVEDDMRRRRVSKKAEHLRDCLLADRAGAADALAEHLGAIGIALNAIGSVLEAHDDDVRAQIKPLIQRVNGALRRINLYLNQREG